jgi:glycerol-3-phosphate acyltransferase PlsY
MIWLLSSFLLAYIVGSIPTAVWVGKLWKSIDIREHGSGNAGTTNTFRILGWKAGSIVAIMDISKGFVAAEYVSKIAIQSGQMPASVVGWNTSAWITIMCGIIAVVGHMYPILAGFRGGKGVITAAGMLYAIEPISITLAITVFTIVLFTSRYVSLASIVAVASYPIFLGTEKYILGWRLDPSYFIFSLIITTAIIVKHHANIQRLLAGTETRVRSFAPAKGWLNKKADEA